MARYSTSRLVKTMVREMERESKRQARVRQQEIAQRERNARQAHKENQKQMVLEAAELEVARFENEIELLLSFHKEAVDPVDWDVQLRALPSALPYRIQFEALKAEREQIFKDPSINWESILHTRQSAEDGASSQPPQLPQERRDGRQLAREVLKGGEDAYIEAINQLSTLDELQESGCELDLIYHDPDRFEVVLQLAGMDVIPVEEKTLRANGKASVKKMAVKKRGELYQDYICSCMLRVAREVFAVLPVKELLLHAQVPLPSNGDSPDELSPVYSVRLNRGGLAGLDFDNLDPSDTIESFPHEGDFKASRKAGAFLAIEPVTFDFSQPLSSRPTISELRTKVAEFRERFSEQVSAD